MASNKEKARPKAATAPKPGTGRRLTAQVFLSMDGVMQAPGATDEDREGGFRLGGWSMSFWDGKMGEVMTERLAKPKELLLGRKTYDIFASYWPKHRDEPGGDALNKATKHVASRKLKTLEWENSHLLKGDAATAVAKLKKEPGPDLGVIGSSDLLQTLLKNDLVDELDLWVSPVVLGSGKRLFGSGAIPTGWTLKDTNVSTTGVVIARYERAGAVPVVPRTVR